MSIANSYNLHHISTLSRLECVEHIVSVGEGIGIESHLLACESKIPLRSRIEMDHMREDDRHDSEVLREEDESLITRGHL